MTMLHFHTNPLHLTSLTMHPAAAPSLGGTLHAAGKRALDLAVATLALLLLAPLWLVVAIAIRLDSRGPVFFRQERIGRDGRPFFVFKFRTMAAENDDSIHRAYVANFIANGAASEVAGGKQYFKLRRDPRVTRVGRFLRKTSIDELPQLINVLRGEMSLVGPRPALRYEVEQWQPWHHERLRSLPGITGMWQVYGRSRVTFDEMCEMDIAYVRRPSLLLDLKLLLLTVPVMLFGIGGG